MGVDIFFSLMRSYFCLLVAAFRPCQGREPRLKYMRTYPSDSRSSRLDCSGKQEVEHQSLPAAEERLAPPPPELLLPIPRCVLMEA